MLPSLPRIAQTLDASGWLCPQPLIAARLALGALSDGDCLEVIVTDPHGPLDFEVFCQRNKHRLLAIEPCTEASPASWRIYLQKSAH